MYKLKELLRIFAQKTKLGKTLWIFLSNAKQVLLNDTRNKRIPNNMSVSEFFNVLNENKCRYVVLRWFDELPKVQYGGDIDILVHDEDVEIIERYLTRSPRKGGIPCDVYSVSGLPSYSYNDIAYYPPTIAEQILQRSVKHRTGAHVPSFEDYFFSLAFHALYHKGCESGLPLNNIEPAKYDSPNHDFHKTLSSMATELGLNVQIDMSSLDQLLKEKGWRPSLDMLERLGHNNEWCFKIVNDVLKDMPLIPGLAVFIVREVASSHSDESSIKRDLERSGFKIIRSKRLRKIEQLEVAKLLRGGNWGEKSSVMSGGLPAIIIAAVDPSPKTPSQELLKKTPILDNTRIVEVKSQIRDKFFKHVIHSTDSARQAAHYLEVTMPGDMKEILKDAERINKNYASI